jgi:hypothetical protein
MLPTTVQDNYLLEAYPKCHIVFENGDSMFSDTMNLPHSHRIQRIYNIREITESSLRH